MKSALNRLKYDLLKGSRSMIIKAVLFTAVFTVILSSTLIKNLSTAFENYMTTDMELFLYLDNSYSSGNYQDNAERYRKEITVLEDMFELDDSDYCKHSSTHSPFHTFGILEDGSSVVYYQNSSLDYKKTLDEELEKYRDSGSQMVFSGRLATLQSVRSDRYVRKKDAYGKLRESILKGRAFSQQELADGSDVCIAGTAMHYYGSDGSGGIIHVGSQIPVTLVIRTDEGPVFGETVWLEVVGTSNFTAGLLVPEKTFDRLTEKAEKLIEDSHAENSYYLDYSENFIEFSSRCSYQIGSLEKLDEIVEYLEAHRSETVAYHSNSSQFTGLISSVSSITGNFGTIMYISLILCAFVSLTAVVLEIFFRKKEIGLLLSMGERKSGIVAQLVMEQVICIAIALLVATRLSSTISTSVATDIIRNNVFTEDRYLKKLFTYSGADSMVVNNINESAQITAEELITLNYEGSDIVMICCYITVIIIANVTVTSILVSRNNPKELMQAE